MGRKTKGRAHVEVGKEQDVREKKQERMREEELEDGRIKMAEDIQEAKESESAERTSEFFWSIKEHFANMGYSYLQHRNAFEYFMEAMGN
jgi:hypothetical protein